MATEADIPAPICETRTEQGGLIVDQATSDSIQKLPQEEKTQADAPNEPPTVEGEDFLKTSTVSKVQCEVNKILPDSSKVSEKPDQTVKDETVILLLKKPEFDDQPLEIAASEETSSKIIQENVQESNEIKFAEKLDTEAETASQSKLSENEENVSMLEEDMETEKHVESLNVAPEEIKISNLSKESETSSEEEGSTNMNLHGITSGDTEEKTVDVVHTQNEVLESFPTVVSGSPEEGSVPQGVTSECTDEKAIDEVDTKKEVLENFSTIVPNEENEESLMIKVDGKHKELLEKLSEEPSLSLPLAREANDDESMVMHEAQIEDGELRKAELCDNEKSEESILLKVEPKVEKPEESMKVASEDIKESDLGQEIETKSYLKEQNVTAQQRVIPDEKTDEETLEKFPTVSNEKIEGNSLTQVDCTNMKFEDHLGKDSTEIADDGAVKTTINEVIIEAENPSRAELFQEEKNIESDLGQQVETKGFLKEQSLTESLEENSGDKTEERTIDAADLTEKTPELQNVAINVSIEDASQTEHDINLENEIEKPCLKEEKLQDAPEDYKASASNEDIETPCSLVDQSLTAIPQAIMSDKTTDAIDTKEVNLDVQIQPEMATEADIPAPICETRTEQGRLIVDQATSISIDKFPQEEKTQADAPNEPPTAEGEDFLTTSKVSEVHCEVNKIFPDSSTISEKPDQTVRDETVILLLKNPKFDDQPLEIAAREETSSKIIQENAQESNEINFADKLDTEAEKASQSKLSKNEENISVLKEDMEKEKHVESLNVAPEEIKISNLSKENKTTYSSEEGSTNMNLHGITSDDTEEKTIDTVHTSNEVLESFPTIVSSSPEEGSVLHGVTSECTDEKTIDEVDTKKEVLEDFSTIVSNEENEEKDEELLEKESEKPSLPLPLAREANDDESMVMHEARIEHGELTKAELCDNEKSEESTLLNIEPQVDWPEDSLNVASEDVKESHLGQEIDTISYFEEQNVTAQSQIIPDEKTDEETLENFPTVSNEKTKENSLTQVDSAKMKIEDHLVKDFTEVADDGAVKTTINEVIIEDENPSRAELFQEEKNIETDLCQRVDTKGFLKEQSLIEKLDENSCDKAEERTIDAADSNEKTQELQNVAINVSTEDASQKEHDINLENEIEKPCLKEASTTEAPEENVGSTSLKKEKLQDAAKDYKASDSNEEIETTCSIEEQSLTAIPQAIMSDKTIDAIDTKKVNLEVQHVATEIPRQHSEENSAIQADCSEMENEEHLEKEIEKSSTAGALTEELNDNESETRHESKDRDEDIIKADLLENEGNRVSTSLKEDAGVDMPNDSLQAACDDIKASDSSQDAKMSCIEEQIITADKQESLTDKTEEKTIDADETKKEILENIATNIPDGDNQDKSSIEEGSLQKQSLDEASMENANDNETTVAHEGEFLDECSIKTDLFENEKNTEGTSMKEEVSIESSQVAAKDIKEIDLGQNRETSSLEDQTLTTNSQGIVGDNEADKTNEATVMKDETHEDKNIAANDEETEVNSVIQAHCSPLKQVEHLEKESESTFLTEAPIGDTTESTLFKIADPQEVSCETEEKSADATYTDEKNLEDLATNVPNGENEDNSPIEVDGSQTSKVSLMGKNDDDDDESTIIHEAKLEDQTLIKAELFENEKSTECNLVKEEVFIRSMEVLDEDMKASASVQDIETSSMEEQGLTTDPPEIIGDHEEKESIDAAEICEDKNVAPTIPHEDTLIQVECQMEQKEHLEKESEKTSLIEAAFEETTESTSKDEAVVEKATDSFQVVKEDIEESASVQDIKISPIEEQIPITDPQEISCDKTEEKTIDGSYTEDQTLEGFVTNVSSGDDKDSSPTEEDGSQRPYLEEASTGHANEEESTITDDAKFVGADERNDEGTMLKEEASVETVQAPVEDIKASASSQDTVTSSLDVQSQTITYQEIMSNHQEDEKMDATDLKEEMPEHKDIAPTIPHKGNEDISLIQVHSYQIEKNEQSEEDCESSSLTEAPTGDTTESDLSKETHAEKPTDSFQVANEDIEQSTSSQETQTTSIKDETLAADSQETFHDKIKEETLQIQDIATNVPNVDNEDSSAAELDGSPKPSFDEASMGNDDDHESIMHEAEFVDESLIKANLFENEQPTGGTMIKEEIAVDDIKASASCQDRESSSLEEQSLTTNPQEVMADNKEEETIDPTDLSEETSEDKEPKEIENVDNKAETTELNEEVYLRDLHMTTAADVAAHEEKASSSIAVHIQSTNDLNIEKDMVVDIAEDPNCKQEESSITEVSEEHMMISNCFSKIEQNENSEKESESSSLTEAPTVETIESALLKEAHMEKSIDSCQVVNEDIDESISCQETETNSIKEEILNANPEETSGEKIKEETTDATDTKEKTLEVQDIATNVPNGDNEDNAPTEVDDPEKPPLKEALTGNTNDHESEIMDEAEFVDESSIKTIEGTPIKEESVIESLQVAAEDIKASASGLDRETTSLEEKCLTANPQGIMCDNKDGETIHQTELDEETSTDKVPKEIEIVIGKAETIESNEEEVHLRDLHTTAAVDVAAHEENGSSSIAIKTPSTNDLAINKDVVVDIAEDPNCKQEESPITQVSEEHMMISNENATHVTNSASEISELNNDYKDVGESNVCDKKTNTENMGLLDDGSTIIPTKENLVETNPEESTEAESQVPNVEKETELMQETSNPFQESREETHQEAENKETEKQYEVHVPALSQDSSMEKTEEDVQLCLESANDSDISQEMQKPDDSITDKTDCKENETVDDATKNKYTEVLLDETAEEIKEPTEIAVPNDSLTKSFTEASEVDHSNSEREVTINREELQTGKTVTGDDDKTKIDKDEHEEEEAAEQKISDFSSENLNMIEARDQDVGKVTEEANTFYETVDTTESSVINKRSIPDIETEVDNEAPATTEGQDVKSTCVRETPALTSQCERHGHEHAYVGSVIEEKLEANEVKFSPEEDKSGYASKTQVLESIAQVQSCDIVSKAKETEIEEEELEAAGARKAEKVGAEDIFEPKETSNEEEPMKIDISSEKFKEEDQDLGDPGSYKEEIITESRLEDEVAKESEEADDKAVVEPEENLLTNESIDRVLHKNELGKGAEEVTTILDTEEVKSTTIVVVEDEENRTEADENKMMKDEALLSENSNNSTTDAAAGEQTTRLDENIICEAPPTKTVHETIKDSEGKREDANAIMLQHQEEDNKSKHESLPVPEYTQENKSEKQDQKREICSSDEVQAKDGENLTAGECEEEANGADTCSKPTEDEERNTIVEAEKLDFSSHTDDTPGVSLGEGAKDIPEDNENSTKCNYYEEKYPNESSKSQISTASKDIEITEIQATKAGGDCSAAPEVSENCKGMEETFTPLEPTTISKLEYTVGTSMETKDHHTKLDDLAQESNNETNKEDVSDDVQELNGGFLEVSNKETSVEDDPTESIEARVSSEGHETEAIQESLLSESLKQEVEEAQPGMTSEAVSKANEVNCGEEKTIDDKCNQLLENSSSSAAEKVSESTIHQSSLENTAQMQIDSLPILLHDKCSDIETAEKDLPMHSAGLEGIDATEQEVSPLPSKDKHTVLDEDHTKNINPESPIGNKNISTIQHGDSAECALGELEMLKPSKPESQEAACGHEEITSQAQEMTESREKSESKERDKHSLSELLQNSVKKTSEMANHSAIEEEPTGHIKDLQAEKTDEGEHEDAKTDEEKDDEDESSGQKGPDLGSEAPVMVDMGDADVKVAHKKSHNLLSGVGSKVKHSIAKVKKVITGKSSHPKPPPPT